MIEVDTVIEAAPWEGAGLGSLADRAVHATLAHLCVHAAEVVVLGCDDSEIARLNAGFRDRSVATNVLSWPSAERSAEREGAVPAPPAEVELGDIAIAYETCAAEAEAAGKPLQDHALHLLVHATLHLLGYDHERDGDAVLMESTEVEILAALGLPDPYDREAMMPDNGKVR